MAHGRDRAPHHGKKVYCCVVLACFARTAVSRSFATINGTALVNRAITRAQRTRKREGARIMHSDHGSNFTSWGFTENLRTWDLTP
ncbi:DDE-type integrase/transposase/recombinase [Arthrobacter rhombi]|uniref:DDE-type integrase/transposase/recombinase n=1 Tax=Arthrobacter rhombi TaxID=71253 RepID=UPI003FD5A9B2